MTTFAQLSARLKNFLRGWLLVLGLKKGLVECATVCVKSVVILMSHSHIACSWINSVKLEFWIRALEGEVTYQEWRAYFRHYKAFLDLPWPPIVQGLHARFPTIKCCFDCLRYGIMVQIITAWLISTISSTDSSSSLQTIRCYWLQ